MSLCCRRRKQAQEHQLQRPGRCGLRGVAVEEEENPRLEKVKVEEMVVCARKETAEVLYK